MPRALKIFQNNDTILDDVQVASPCPAEWGDMVGSDTVRFCAGCQKNVYNLSGMKRDEAIDLLRATEGKLCVRFFRRQDGTILTEDCPVGVAAVLRRAKRMTLAAAALSLGAVAALLAMLGGTLTKKTCQRINDVRTTIEDVIPPEHTMGEPVALPEPVQGGVAPMPEPVKPVPMMGKVAPRLQEVKGGMRRPEPPPVKTMGLMVAPKRSTK